MQKQTGKTPRELIPPVEADPILLEYMRLFGDVARGRQFGDMGARPLSYLDIDAFCRLSGVCLDAYDLDILLAIDGAFLKVAKDGSRKP